jgi:phosphoserine phosphatase
MLVDVSDSKIWFGELQSRLLKKAEELKVKINIEPYDEYGVDFHKKKSKKPVLVTLLGKDRPGIVNKFSELFYNLDSNIERIRMIARGEIIVVEFMVDIKKIKWEVLREKLQKEAEAIDMNIIFQPKDVFHRAKKLVVFDMDSTIVDAEVIDEIGRVAGVEEEVKGVTRRAMNGEIEFEDALRERVKLLKGLPVEVLGEIAENLELTPGAQELLITLKELGYKIALISGGFTFFTEKLKEKLNFDYAYANELVVKDGKLTGEVSGKIIDANAKRDIIKEIAKKEGITMDEVIAVGDGANDRFMLRDVGLGIGFNPKGVLKEYADGVLTEKNLKGILYCLGDYREKILRDGNE